MYKETTGMVTAVRKQWWLKINTKPIRCGALDGAIFPHIITVKYTVNDVEYTKRKWLGARIDPPDPGALVTLKCDEVNPKKAKIIYP